VTPTRSRTPLAALLATLAVASGAAGGLLLATAPEATGADVGQVPVAVAVAGSDRAAPPADPRSLERPRSAPAGLPRRPRDTTPSRARPGAPARLLIDSVGLGAAVVPVGAHGDGQLVLPEEPRTVGWWVGSAPAGHRRGSTVLAGHVDSASGGLGALAVLRTLPVGARIVLADVFGTRHAYRVAARRSYPKATLPSAVLGGGQGPRLVLVTCGGPFDEARRSYRDNLVVYAVPA
jgi:sortase family protein